MGIRSTAKAIIVQNGKILLNKCVDEKNGDYYTLPGGGQNTFESLSETLVRECLEETGYSVSPIRLIALCEEIYDDPISREKFPEYAHKLHHIFICKLCSDKQQAPTEKDSSQIESEWVAISSINNIRLLPHYLGKNIVTMINSETQTFFSTEHIPLTYDWFAFSIAMILGWISFENVIVDLPPAQ